MRLVFVVVARARLPLRFSNSPKFYEKKTDADAEQKKKRHPGTWLWIKSKWMLTSPSARWNPFGFWMHITPPPSTSSPTSSSSSSRSIFKIKSIKYGFLYINVRSIMYLCYVFEKVGNENLRSKKKIPGEEKRSSS